MIGQIIHNYKIVSKIADGGMGMVYLGEQLKLNRKVAIKQLHSNLTSNPQFKERFFNEAKILASLNHQNIITVYDLIKDGNQFYIVMAYIDGQPIDDIIQRTQTPFEQNRCIKIFKEILSAFSYAHKKRIIHRDIKPANIMLQHDDTPKILDFGIAKMIGLESKLTKTGTKMGSLYYMSPEQVKGYEVDKRTDIYSLGIVLFEMLTGKLPYDVSIESEYEIMDFILKRDIISILSYNSSINRNIESVIYKACSKDPNLRFQSCEEFSNALSNQNFYVSRSTKVFSTSEYQEGAQMYGTPQRTGTLYEAPEYQRPVKRTNRTTLYIFGSLIAIIIIVIAIIYIPEIISNIDGSKITKTDETKQKEKELKLKEKELDLLEEELNKDDNKETRSGIPGDYPEASSRYLSDNDLKGLSKHSLRIMRNEIFARYGYIFKTDAMRSHFIRQSWYTPKYNDVNSLLTPIEKANINLIKSYE